MFFCGEIAQLDDIFSTKWKKELKNSDFKGFFSPFLKKI
jgi:hypothetical protein